MYECEDRHGWFVGRRRIILDQLARYGAGGRILDVGCGTGGMLAHLDRYGDAYGVDVSLEAIGHCRRRGAPVAVGSGLDLPFPEETFDAVLALDVIEHVEDDVAVLREGHRVLRPGGIAVVTVPALPWLWSGHDVAHHHHRRYLRAGLRRAVRAAGLWPIKLSYYNALLLPLMAARKAILRGNGNGHHLDVLPPAGNALMRGALGAEKLAIRRWDIPLGASLVCVARRPIDRRTP